MKNSFVELSQTGSAGPASTLEQKIMQVMSEEVHIYGDITGSSVAGIEERGK